MILVKHHVITAVVLLLSNVEYSEPEIFSSTSEMNSLIRTLNELLNVFEEHINSRLNVMKLMNSHLEILDNYNEYVKKNTETFIESPINGLTLILKLTNDATNVKKIARVLKEIVDAFDESISKLDVRYPERDDVLGAATGFMRLKEFYNLINEELSVGKIAGVSYSPPMSASDCYTLAKALNETKDYENALEWMFIAGDKYLNDDTSFVNENEMLEFIGHTFKNMGEFEQAKQWAEGFGSPTHGGGWGSKLIEEITEAVNINLSHPHQLTKEEEKYARNEELFFAHCQNEFEVTPEIKSKLKCYYSTNNHPFLLLSPIKTEQMYIDPEIVRFHDIISDDERESVLKIAENKRLKRSFVQLNATFGTAVSYRVSKQTWIEYEDYDVTRRIARRISSVTGLDLTYGEPLQVANYGIGGHYKPHYDFLTRGDLAPGENITKNRYATVLFYLSDVTQGGATVFPHLGVYVKPFKNTAVFWINLYSSCEGNFALMHAACPVLQGSKWVSTIWVEQIGQELIRPCRTEYQHEGFHRLHTAKRKNNA